MYSNFTFLTAGELTGVFGSQNGGVPNKIEFSSYTAMDDLRITAAQQRLTWVLDLVPQSKVIFGDFQPEESSMISKLGTSSSGPFAVVNSRLATAVARREDNSIRFTDTINGHIAALHGILRVLFSSYTPNDTILGHAHFVFTTVLYSMIISAFRKNYSIYDLPEENLASIRYACACVSAAKHFELSCSINDVSIPMTSLLFGRVPFSYYATDNNITSYEAMAEYLKSRANLANVDKITFINSCMMTLGQRALVILESGVDMIIDCLLSKSSSRILSKNLYRQLGQQYDNLHKKVAQSYSQQISLGIETGGE